MRKGGVRFQPLPLAGLPLSHYVRRGRKDYSTAYVSIKGNLLLLCVAEQYRGAVELSEIEGLRKSIWVIITFTMMFRNQFVPQAIPLFVEPQRLWLVASTDKETPKFAVFFNPFPLRDFPYLTSFAGAEKITLRLTRAEKVAFCSSVLRSNIGELSSCARLRG